MRVSFLKILQGSFFLLLCSLLLPLTISAHTLKYDGPIGAVLHITPDDDPIIGQSADFFFEFKDKSDKFKPNDCNCQVTITKENENLFTTFLTASAEEPSLNSASFSYTFPEKGVYHIKVIGKALTADAFPNFELNYDLRVERTTGSNLSNEGFLGQNLHFVLLFVLLAVFVIFLAFGRVRKNLPLGKKEGGNKNG